MAIAGTACDPNSLIEYANESVKSGVLGKLNETKRKKAMEKYCPELLELKDEPLDSQD